MSSALPPETGDVLGEATRKRAAKKCDWIVANDVSPGTGTFGGNDNVIHLVGPQGAEAWPRMAKSDVGRRLAGRIADHFAP